MPKSSIYSPNLDDDHPRTFDMGVPNPLINRRNWPRNLQRNNGNNVVLSYVLNKVYVKLKRSVDLLLFELYEKFPIYQQFFKSIHVSQR